MLTIDGCFALIFLGVTAVAATWAFRSAWKRRFEAPLSTLRLTLMVLLLVVAVVLAIVTRNDAFLVPIIGGLFVVSVGWLIIKGL